MENEIETNLELVICDALRGLCFPGLFLHDHDNCFFFRVSLIAFEEANGIGIWNGDVGREVCVILIWIWQGMATETQTLMDVGGHFVSLHVHQAHMSLWQP